MMKLDAMEILWPLSEAIDNLRDMSDRLLDSAADSFKSGDDQEAESIRGLARQIAELADDLESEKEGFAERLGRVLDRLGQEHVLPETFINSKGDRTRKRSFSTSVKPPVPGKTRRGGKAFILGSKDSQYDTSMDLGMKAKTELEAELRGDPIDGVHLTVQEDGDRYVAQQTMNIKAIVEAELGDGMDEDTLIEIEEECMKSLFRDGKGSGRR